MLKGGITMESTGSKPIENSSYQFKEGSWAIMSLQRSRIYHSLRYARLCAIFLHVGLELQRFSDQFMQIQTLGCLPK